MTVRRRAVDLWKRCVPREQQLRVVEARSKVRHRSDPNRPLPELLVIGTQRGGTSSLYKWLELHPCVVASLRKETEFFTARWCKGESWYRAQFPSRARRSFEARRRGLPVLSFEASPNYLFHPLAAERAADVVPQVKLVVLLRNPIDRAFSQYHHEVRRGREDLPFDQAVAAEAGRLSSETERMEADPGYIGFHWNRHSYVARGHYADQLERWMAAFPPERFLVLRSEDLYADPAASYDELVRFLGLAPFSPEEFRNHSYLGSSPPSMPALPPSLRAELCEVFAESNHRLASLLGRDLAWQ